MEGDGQYITIAEAREILEKETEARENMKPEQGFALQHAREVSRLPGDVARQIVEELKQIEGVTEQIAVTLVDIKAEHPDDVRAVFYKERIDLTEDLISRILETMEKYQ